MARPINATLFVNSFLPTGTPGEYTFDSALFNNQTDATGNGALDATIGSVLYVPASDINTGFAVTGVVHRYRITQLQAIDPQTLSGTMIWDEKASGEIDVPGNGVYCLYSESTPTNHFGLPPSEAVYPELSPGSSMGSILLDTRDITDTFAPVAGSPPVYLVGVTSGSGQVTLTPKTFPPVIPNDSSAIYKISVLGRRTDAVSEGCAFQFVGLVNRNSNSSTTALIGAPQKTIVARSNTSWDAAISADTVNGGVSVQVVGTEFAQIEWTASIDLVKSTT